MRVEVFPGTCGVCGEDGVGSADTMLASWGVQLPKWRKFATPFVSHRNPRVCADNLRRAAKAKA